MRISKILAAPLLVLVMTLGTGVAANAASSTPHISESAKKCIELLESGKKIDDCQKAPSPILPDKNELIWGAASFTILLVLMWKFAWPGLKKAMEDRTEKIRSDLAAAEQAKLDAEGVKAQHQAEVAGAKGEGAKIIEEARQTADALKAERVKALEVEIAELRARANAEIESAKTQALADLRGEVANIAIGAAEQVVEHALDADTNRQLVENFISKVGAS